MMKAQRSTLRAMRTRMQLISARVGGVGTVRSTYSRCESLADRPSPLTTVAGAYGVVSVPRPHPSPWASADGEITGSVSVSIDPADLRPGDLIVDDDGNVFAEVLATLVDPGNGSVWVSPLPCASMTSLDIEFSPGLPVDVVLPRPNA